MGMKTSNTARGAHQRFAKQVQWKWKMERLLDRLSIPAVPMLQQQIEPIQQVYRQVELFVPAHKEASPPTSLLLVSQQYEQINWKLERPSERSDVSLRA
jgi:hypothetical protein